MNIRRLLLAYVVFIFTLSVAGQGSSVTVADLSGVVNRGLKSIERGPYRYSSRIEGNRTMTLEVDAKRSIRVKNSDLRTGIVTECIIIGGRIYHRSGYYPWISQTRDEFETAQGTLTALMKHARANKDSEAFERAKSATLNNPAIFQALIRPSISAVIAGSDASVSGKTIAFIGNLPYKDKVARLYRLRWNVTEFPKPSPGILSVRTEIVYAFDQETGALLNAQTRSETAYESTTKTFFITDEWESDPSLVITPPAIAASK